MIRPLRLAALAAIPERAAFLPRVLGALRRQVDVLCVYLNGWKAAPPCVQELADRWVVDPENAGAERKLHWAESHSGIYLSCDDDYIYPGDYVATLTAEVERWSGLAIVTAHGRCYKGSPRNILETVPGSVGILDQTIASGRWVNHGGTGAMAWDTRGVTMPARWAERNMADMQVAIWAQRNRIPIRLIPHRAQWVRGLNPRDPRGLYHQSQLERHRRRTAALHRVEWQLFSLA